MSEVRSLVTDANGKIKIVSLDKFNMFAPNSVGKNSKLAWCVRDGNPRLTVFTNDPNDTNEKTRGIISAPMDPITFAGLMNILAKVCAATSETSMYVDCYTSYRDEAGKQLEKVLLSKVAVGKDATGVVWISVLADGRPNIKFVFGSSIYHVWRKSNGEALSLAEASVLTATATIKVITPIYDLFLQEAIRDQVENPRAYNTGKQTTAKASPYGGADSIFEDINM